MTFGIRARSRDFSRFRALEGDVVSPSPDQSTYILPDANESTQFECKACEWFIREQVWDRGQTLHGPSKSQCELYKADFFVL